MTTSTSPAAVAPLVARLQHLLGAESVLTGDEDRRFFSQDISGPRQHVAACVIRPQSVEQLSRRRRGGDGRRVLRRCARRSDVVHGRVRSGSRCMRDRGHARARARRRDQYGRHVRDGRGRLHLGSAVRGARAARRAHAILGTAVRSIGHDRRRTVAELDPVGLGALRSVGRERARTRRGARGRQPARDRSRRTAARRSHSCAITGPT